jgi:uncharacterized protein (TIGR03083 family)
VKAVPDFTRMVQAERATLAPYLESLSPAQWTSATWCDKWNVQQVVGHLIAAANITAPHFIGGFIKSGFNFDKVVEADLVKYAAGSPADVLKRFKGIIDSTRKPPGPGYVSLGEVMVHGEDIRRALGGKGDHPRDHVVTLAAAYCKTGKPLNGKKRSAGLKFVADDMDWSVGDGPEVKGPAMSLILAMVGRRKALDDCTGTGVEILRAR